MKQIPDWILTPLELWQLGVNKLRSKDNAVVVITHYQRLLDYIVPDFVHVLYDGKIVKSGDASLALELEEKRLRLDQT